jgi:hypothetical protein
MDRDALKRELTEQFQQSLDQAMEAVERAPDGAWISASEWEVRELFQELTARAFERILQAKLDAAEASGVFSPSGAAQTGRQGQARSGCAHRGRRSAAGAQILLEQEGRGDLSGRRTGRRGTIGRDAGGQATVLPDGNRSGLRSGPA